MTHSNRVAIVQRPPVTKETLLHPVIEERFEEAPSSTVRSVLPDASHDSFTDGPLFQPDDYECAAGDDQ